MSDQRPGPPPHSPASGDASLELTGATPLRPSDPARLGPYVPLGLLGSGGMGRVYLTRLADDGPGLAAVKVIRPEYAEDTEFRRRFQREAGVHDRIRTPYAPRLLGTGFDPEDEHGRELLWMATEYLPGLNLTDAVRDCGTLPPAAVWRLVGELGRALSALAAAGVVHRDLKPSNVLLSADGVHVIDFGISQAVDSSAITITGSRVGTPAYMSPEYLRDGRCDSASDVFSLAGTLVYAVTGHAPFGDGTGVDVMHRVAFEEPKPTLMSELASADPALAALLTACLAKNPADRPTPARLTEAATDTGRPWPDPLNSRLLARRQSCTSLARATAQETAHLRLPTRRTKTSTPAPTPAPVPGFGPAEPAGATEGSGAAGAAGSAGVQAHGSADAPGASETPAPHVPGGHAGPPGGPYGDPTPVGTYGASPPPGAYGVPTPAGTYGPPTPVTAYGASTSGGGGAYGAHAPAPGSYGGPPTSGGGQGLTVTSVAPRRRRGPYFVVVAAFAMCAVAVGAYFVTRAPVEDSASAAPTAGASTAPDGQAAAPLPGSPDSPSPSAEKSKEKGDGDSPSVGPSRATADATPGDTADPTPGAGGSSGVGGDSDRDAASTPTPPPTRTATKPATPAWISQCTYYSGTELTDRGDEGQRVVQVQCMLQKRGYSVGGSGVDGKFGKDTESAVKQFQSAKGLEVDGQVGPNTWAALRGTT
ncbi:serine/threonine-protein kinase [Streptomyces sp. SP18BB07]|uniref:serine/threonine-protein kinase n=1 Tax=Streptomyces sp. SP18BB07 TaxID=3002522 RepID=UPI002E79ACE1|nr:serine/threonine-protein kinase [Streptomyces sp. SP18BB07]MEE1758943.1 serine/threonine-protein kinase [Streptomyces sp. SP18BB07]